MEKTNLQHEADPKSEEAQIENPVEDKELKIQIVDLNNRKIFLQVR